MSFSPNLRRLGEINFVTGAWQDHPIEFVASPHIFFRVMLTQQDNSCIEIWPPTFGGVQGSSCRCETGSRSQTLPKIRFFKRQPLSPLGPVVPQPRAATFDCKAPASENFRKLARTTSDGRKMVSLMTHLFFCKSSHVR